MSIVYATKYTSTAISPCADDKDQGIFYPPVVFSVTCPVQVAKEIIKAINKHQKHANAI